MLQCCRTGQGSRRYNMRHVFPFGSVITGLERIGLLQTLT